MSNTWEESDVMINQYPQGRINVSVKFDTATMNNWKNKETQAGKTTFANSGNSNVFDVYPWEPLFQIENSFLKTQDANPRVLTSLNGLGGIEYDQALEDGGEEWLSDLITSKLTYVGHAPQKWNADAISVNDQPLTAQIAGVRGFYAFKETPLNSLVYFRAPTLSEAQQYARLPPHDTIQGKIPCLVLPFDLHTPADNFCKLNNSFISNREMFNHTYSYNVDRNSRLIRTLTYFNKSILTMCIAFLHAIVRDDLIKIAPGPAAKLRPTTDPVGMLLSKSESNNWILTFACKLGLLPSMNYSTLSRVNKSPETIAEFKNYSTILLNSIMPANNADLYFGYDKATGQNPGFDRAIRSVKNGTAQGDIITAIVNNTHTLILAVNDWIYYSTKNVIGRTIIASRETSYGSFI